MEEDSNQKEELNQEQTQNENQNTNSNQNVKEVGTAKKVAGSLIGNYFVYAIVAGLIYRNVISKFLQKSFGDNITVMAIVSIACSALISFVLWKLSVVFTFNKMSLAKADVSKVMKKLVAFIVILCVISGALNYIDYKSSIDKTKHEQLERFEVAAKQYASSIDIQQYKEQLEAKMDEAVKPYTKTLIISLIGESVAYLAILILVRKDIMKRSVEENQ